MCRSSFASLVVLSLLVAGCAGGPQASTEPGPESVEVGEPQPADVEAEAVDEAVDDAVAAVEEATDAALADVGHAPRPFTAEQIRDASPKGRFWTSRMEVVGRGVLLMRSWVTASDANGMTMSTQRLGPDGSGVGPVQEQRAGWVELRDHATFPSDRTTITDANIRVGDVDLACRLYTVSWEQAGVAFRNRLYFANERPGAPVVFEAYRDGELTQRMTITEWGLERDG